MARRVYWDACIWFALIKQEPGRFHRCQHLIDQAKRGEVEIWTSALTLAEVFRKQCGGAGVEATGLPEELDKAFEDFLSQDFVFEIQLDRPIGVAARRLLRAHAPLKKPQDAVHLASAMWNNVDEFHTFDAANLLCLEGLITTREGNPLKICEPPEPPPATPDLFSSLPSEKVAAPPVLADPVTDEINLADIEAIVEELEAADAERERAKPTQTAAPVEAVVAAQPPTTNVEDASGIASGMASNPPKT